MIRIAGAVLGVAVAAAAWLFLAPAQLGGSTGYVVLYGTSMEPTYSAGDLVLVRPVADVKVGDVVAYHHPELGRTVLHRVVQQRGDLLQLKGDNNEYLDLPHATKVDVVGREWLHIPAVGGALEWVRQPVPAAAIALLCVLLLAGGGASAVRRREGRSEPPAAQGASEAEAAKARRALEAMAVLGGMVVLGLLLGLVAWTRPTTERVAFPDRWRHDARLSYETPVRSSAVYPDGRVDTGETVFARQVPKLRVRFEYALHTREAEAVRLAGTASLVARIRGDNGWRRTLPLATERVRPGVTALAGELDLRAIQAMAGRVESLTGTHATAYDVTVAAAVDVDGEVAGDAVRHHFAPTFAFRLHDGRLEPAEADPSSPTPATWSRTEPGEGTRVAPARVSFGPAVVEVGDLRYAAVALGLLALVGVPFALLYVLWPRPGDGADPLEPWLVDVARIPAAREVRDVPSTEALLRLAERYDTVVLRVQRPAGRLLGVEVGGILYRHLVGEVDDWPDEPRQPSVTYLSERAAR